jgi:hypothetical protein
MKRMLLVAGLAAGLFMCAPVTAAQADDCASLTDAPKASVICTVNEHDTIGLDALPVGAGSGGPGDAEVVCALGTGPNTRDGICVWFTVP